MQLARRCARTFLIAGLMSLVPSVVWAEDPPAGTAYVESSKVAARVYYDPAYKTMAEQSIAVIEQTWQTQITEMGFSLPQRLRAGKVEAGFDAYFSKLDAYALYTFDVQGDNAATPQSDCPVLAKINGIYMTTADDIADAIGHLLNHASLHADECLEPSLPSYDIFSVGAQMLSTGTVLWTDMVAAFQRFPYYALDAVPGMAGATSSKEVYYSFGSGLYAVFLDERYGKGDGKLLPVLWRRGMQDGHILTWSGEQTTGDVENTPDFFGGIDLGLKDLKSSFDEAFVEFCVWRYFVGANDDGKHFKKGAQWKGGEVVIDTTLGLGDLPVVDREPKTKLASYGTAYIGLDTSGAGAADTIKIAFAPNADSSIRWAASVIRVPASGGAAEVTAIALDGKYVGSIELDKAGTFARTVLVVADLADKSYRPKLDPKQWMTQHSFRYSISRQVGLAVSGAQPAQLTQGDDHVKLRVSGQGFVAGPALAATLGAGVTVHSTTLASATALDLVVSVGTDAATGKRDLSITDGDGRSITAKELIEIKAAAVTPPPDTTPDTGGCVVAGGSTPSTGLLLLLGAALALGGCLRRRF